MRQKTFMTWYNLPEYLRDKLLGISERFYMLKDHGSWAVGNAGRYEPEAIAVLRTHGTLTWDVVMPALAEIKSKGIRVAVFAPGMRMMDIVFYKSK